MKLIRALFALVVTMLVSASMVSADSQWSQVSWFTAESVAHSISYGIYNSSVACSQTALYYVETAPIDGVETKINASTDSTGSYFCQNITQGAFVVSNDGSVGINLTAVFNQITSGVDVKIGTANGAWQSACTGVCNTTECDLGAACIELNTSAILVDYNLAQNSTEEFWLWSDFNGVAGTVSPTKGNITTTAVKT